MKPALQVIAKAWRGRGVTGSTGGSSGEPAGLVPSRASCTALAPNHIEAS